MYSFKLKVIQGNDSIILDSVKAINIHTAFKAANEFLIDNGFYFGQRKYGQMIGNEEPKIMYEEFKQKIKDKVFENPVSELNKEY